MEQIFFGIIFFKSKYVFFLRVNIDERRGIQNEFY